MRFESFGGVPRTVLYDNIKTVVIKRDAYGPGRCQPTSKIDTGLTGFGHRKLIQAGWSCRQSGRLLRRHRVGSNEDPGAAFLAQSIAVALDRYDVRVV